MESLLYKFFINDKYHGALDYIYFIGIGYFFWAITYYFYSFLLCGSGTAHSLLQG